MYTTKKEQGLLALLFPFFYRVAFSRFKPLKGL
jgi:hypothetical protein